MIISQVPDRHWTIGLVDLDLIYWLGRYLTIMGVSGDEVLRRVDVVEFVVEVQLLQHMFDTQAEVLEMSMGPTGYIFPN